MILQIMLIFLIITAIFLFFHKHKSFEINKNMLFVSTVYAAITALASGNFVWMSGMIKTETFTDFTGGFLAMAAMQKSCEYYAFYTGIIVFTVLFLALNWMYNKFTADEQAVIKKISLYTMIVPALMVGQAFISSYFTVPVRISAISVGCGIITTLLKLRFRELKERETVIFLLSLFFGIASHFCIGLYCNRMGLSGMTVWIYWMIWLSSLFFAFRKGCWNKFLIISQLGLPLAFANLFPVLQILNDGEIFSPGFNKTINIAVMALFISGFLMLYIKFRSDSGSGSDPIRKFIPSLPLAALICMFCADPDKWGYLSADDYHNGEVLLPWFLYQKFDCIMYTDYIPSRGAVNYVPGFFLWLFKGHDFSYIYSFYKWGNLPLYFLALTVLRRRSSLLLAVTGCAAVTALTPGIGAGILLGMICWAYLSDPKWSENPVKMLLIFFITGFIGTIYSLTDTAVVFCAMIPMAGYMLYLAWQQQRRQLLWAAAAAALFGAGLFMIPLSRQILLGTADVLLHQSDIYTTAHCVPLMKHNIASNMLFNIFYITVNYGFILLIIIFSIRLFIPVKNNDKKEFIHYFSTAALVVLGIILIQRAAGRMSCGQHERAMLVTLIIMVTALPVWYQDWSGQKLKLPYLLVFCVITGVYGKYTECFISLDGKYDGVIFEPENTVNPAAAGLPHLGSNTVLDKKHFEHHIQVKSLVDSILSESEKTNSFWDLTNNSTIYAYCGDGMIPPMSYPAYFYVASTSLAEKMRSQIDDKKPILVLIKGKNIEFFEGMLPLRSFQIYTYLLDNYRVFSDVNGKIWMIRKGYEDRLEKSELVNKSSLDNMDLLADALSDKHIDGYPGSWGNSMALLQKKLTDKLPLKFKIMNNKEILLLNPTGRKGDFLYLKFNRPVNSRWINVLWQDSFNGKGQPFISFWGGRSEFLIPLSASCNWYLNRDQQRNLLIIHSDNAAETLQLTEVAMYDRINK